MQTKSPRRGENLISSQARRLITVSVYLRSAYVKFLLQNFPFFSETFTLRICLFVQRLRPYHFTIRSCKQFQSSESLISGASRDCSTNILWIIKFVCSVYIRLNYASSHASSFFFSIPRILRIIPRFIISVISRIILQVIIRITLRGILRDILRIIFQVISEIILQIFFTSLRIFFSEIFISYSRCHCTHS